MFLFGDLTPCVPLSLKGEGEVVEEGLTPLLDTPRYPNQNKEHLKGADASLKRPTLPKPEQRAPKRADAPLRHPYRNIKGL